MAKGSRGGKRSGGGGGVAQQQNVVSGTSTVSASSSGTSAQTQTAQTQAQANNNSTVQNVTPAKSMSASYNQFMAMTDDQKASVITQNIKQGVPVHLADNAFQRFTYNMQLNDKPDVVSESQLRKMSGQDLYRTVNAGYNAKTDVGYSAVQICKQTIGGRVTRTSDNGRSAYGRGIYFATTRSSSTGYGNHFGNVNKTAVMHAKFNSNAKIIDHHKAVMGLNNEIRSGSKLGKALSRCDSASAVSIYAMSKGYNVISDGMNDYMAILNRQAITCSDSFTAM